MMFEVYRDFSKKWGQEIRHLDELDIFNTTERDVDEIVSDTEIIGN